MIKLIKQNWAPTLIAIVGLVLVMFSFWHFFAPISQIIVFAIGAVLLVLPVVGKNPDYGLALVGFFLPFERVPSLDVGGMSVKINYILIVITLVAYVFVNLIKGKVKIPRDPVKYFIVLMLCVFILTIPGALNLTRAVAVFLFMLLMAVVYFTVTLIANKKEVFILVIKGIVWGSIVVAVLGIFQFLGDMAGLPNTITLLKFGYDKSTFGFARVQGASAEPLYFANYIFIPLLITTVLLIKGQVEKIVPRWLALLLVGTLLVDFILAISRGAYLGLGAVFVIFLVVLFRDVFRSKIIIPAVFIIMVVFTGSYLLLIKSEPRALDEFIGHLMVNDATNGESVVSRLDATAQAKEIYASHPILGVGLGNYGPVVQGDPVEAPDSGWFIVNNEYWELLAETGILGFAAFILLILVVFARAVMAVTRSKDELLKSILIGSLLALVGILVQYYTFSTLYIFHIWFLIGLISAISIYIFKGTNE